jgi:acyl CoA:acetate/3-ketoacid CoA transferase beta subunit
MKKTLALMAGVAMMAGLVLRERAPGVSVETIVKSTEARLTVPATVPEMAV